MDLLLVRALWGVEDPWEDAFPQFVARGYGAIEAPLPPPEDRARFRALLDAHGLAYVAMVFTEGEGVAAHVASFRAQTAEAVALGAFLITAHSGRDAWTDAQADAYFEAVLAHEQNLAVPVAHETHRGRQLYAPWAAARLLARFPTLRLCCDFSHWVVVCERLLEDQAEVLALCATRAIHLHARVGYEGGAQVPDPRAPEYARHVAAHEAWWDAIWDAQQAQGFARSTLTPEFGPPYYMPTLPFANTPVADLEVICDWQAARQAERFARRGGLGGPEE